MALITLDPEFRNAICIFEEQVLHCRPRHVISFAVRYFHDEKNSSKLSYDHALHSLPFLLRVPDSFRNAACTVFCEIKPAQSQHCDKKSLSRVLRASIAAVTACAPSVPNVPPATHVVSRKTSIASATSDAFLSPVEANPDLSINWQVGIIESTLKDYLGALEVFDFESFVITLRLHLSCWIIVSWVQDKVSEKETFADLLTSLKRHKPALFWEQMPHPIRQEFLAQEDAQTFCRLLTNALPVNQDVKQLSLHILRGFVSSLETTSA